jgi:uncharacterized membrane protein YeaQ/YmgE (transglycosylase-associated protein family)
LTITEFLILLLVAGICGGIGQALGGYSRGGCLTAIVLGFIGAWLGKWLVGEMDLPRLFVLNIGDTSFPIVWSIIGAALFVVVIGMVTKRRR